ncbi:hypothetical protein GJ496_006045 [Pomphorhynchus laevis]|nr:hypothetical protein GJ496_006045 [Pomphorhynchus laevis]
MSLPTLHDALRKTMSNNITDVQTATEQLNVLQKQNGFAPSLLAIFKDPQSADIFLVAAISLKNFIKKYWRGDELFDITVEDRSVVKTQLISQILICENQKLQKQFSESIVIIASSDFPTEWPDMLDLMLGKEFTINRLLSVVGVFSCLDGIFYKYRHEFKCEALWSEIALVLKSFSPIFFEVTQVACKQLPLLHNLNIDQQRILLEIIHYSVRMFSSLISQELAEHFEDNLTIYMECYMVILNFDLSSLTDKCAQEFLIESKVSVCEALTLLMHIYSNDFMPFAFEFMKTVWTMLISLDCTRTELDSLKCSAIDFLAKTVASDELAKVLSESSALQAVCEQVIIPNITIRDCDFESYEDDPDDFIRRDIENTDTDTPRRAARDFIRALCLKLETQVVTVFGEYIEKLLEVFAQCSIVNWRQKDVATFLVICLAQKGHTAKHGVTISSQLIDLNRFFLEALQVHLTEEKASFPILTADAMKFLAEFRYCLPKDLLISNLPNLIRIIGSDMYTLAVYASYTLERLLSMTNDNRLYFSSDEVKSIFPQLLENLLKALVDHSTRIENEYAIRAILRLVRRNDLIDINSAQVVVVKMLEILRFAASNPRKPLFNHYGFETLGELINWYSLKGNFQIYQSVNVFLTELLDKDVVDFIPYALQLWSLMVVKGNSDLIRHISTHAMNIDRFSSIGSCIPALSKLICFLIYYHDSLLFPSELPKIVNLIRKTIPSKIRDHDGFEILCLTIMKANNNFIQNTLRDIYILIFTRLTSSKTSRFIHDFIHFNSHVIMKFGATLTIDTIDSLQQNLFNMVCQNIYLAELHKVRKNQKVIIIATTKLLTNPLFIDRYRDMWVKLVESLVALAKTENHKEMEASIFEDDSEKLQQLMQASDLSNNELKSCPYLKYENQLSSFASGSQYFVKEIETFLNSNESSLHSDSINQVRRLLRAQ